MKVFTVRIQLPNGRDDDLAYRLLTERFVRMLKAHATGNWSRFAPEGTAVHLADAQTGAALYQCGSFRHAPPDRESAAEEKGDAVREGDRRKR